MQNKNKKMEIARKIEISKNQQFLLFDYFAIKFVKTNIQK